VVGVTVEPSHSCLLVDKDGDVWVHDDNGWTCMTEAAYGLPWAEMLDVCGPFRVYAPLTDGGAVEPPATPRAVPSPAAQAEGAGWRPAPSSPTTDGEAAAPPADLPGASTPAAAESATPTAASPSVLPRPFLLFRTCDVTGLSGIGVVAWGAAWPDGTASLRWATEYPSTVHWDSVDAIVAVHGHQGATVLRWLDGGV
jgi:hypothetical protein